MTCFHLDTMIKYFLWEIVFNASGLELIPKTKQKNTHKLTCDVGGTVMSNAVMCVYVCVVYVDIEQSGWTFM